MKNNQTKPNSVPKPIPPDQMKCNILKAKAEEDKRRVPSSAGEKVPLLLSDAEDNSPISEKFKTVIVVNGDSNECSSLKTAMNKEKIRTCDMLSTKDSAVHSAINNGYGPDLIAAIETSFAGANPRDPLPVFGDAPAKRQRRCGGPQWW
uniref:Uncharacterized protein n=1 Tax=Ixodes ricinus TaxID=34613 RepID=A0A0K8RNR3_IXORI